jgi:hypothetical protein
MLLWVEEGGVGTMDVPLAARAVSALNGSKLPPSSSLSELAESLDDDDDAAASAACSSA